MGQFQLTGTSNATTPPAGTVISVTGSDDWATLQAVLTSGSGTGLVLHLDSAFCLTKSLRLYSDESVESDGSPAHGPHLLAHSDCPIFTTVMVGGQYCGHDIAIHNVFEDCNGFNQDINEASNSWELQGDLAPVEWTHANDIGSVINFTMDGCTIYDSASYALFTHWIQHFKITNNRTCYSIFNGPPYWPYGATHRDGWHGDGPEYDGIVTGNHWTGDDDQDAMLPIEDTSEAGGFYYLSGTATALNPVTTYPSARRGHGGTITNIRIDDVYDNSRSGVRFGQQVNTSGTWLAENIIDQVSVCASGTIYAQMANENTTLWHVAFPVWNVVSGTTGVAGINLGNNYVPGFSDYEIGEVRQDTGVWVNPIYGESSIGGAYGAEIRNLRQGCVATWTFATDTSGSNAYDWTGNGYNLANNNGVTFTSGHHLWDQRGHL